MFFPELITGIDTTHVVLEIGPGATPHPRADVLLERKYSSKEEQFAQSGYAGELQTSKRIFFYDEDSAFPFRDKEFDYVICSHVLEHVNNVDFFISEINRVARRGYFEFPLVYYEYLYNFNEHQNICMYEDGVVRYFRKDENFMSLKSIQKLFWDSLFKGYYYLADDFKKIFFQGFEWQGAISAVRVFELQDVVPDHKKFEIELATLVYKKTNLASNSNNNIRENTNFFNSLKKRLKNFLFSKE